jgi:hypothetical protein
MKNIPAVDIRTEPETPRRSLFPTAERVLVLSDRFVTRWLEAIDPVAAVRGMSSGFSVLIIGSLLAPLIALHVPVVGGFALALAAMHAPRSRRASRRRLGPTCWCFRWSS